MITLECVSYMYSNEDVKFIHDALMAKISRTVNCAEVGFIGECFSNILVFSPLSAGHHFL